MRKKTLVALLVILMIVITCGALVGCKKDDEGGGGGGGGGTEKPVELTREDCDLIFGGEGGFNVVGKLAPSDSAPAIGGSVKAVVPIKAAGADLRFDVSILKLKITLASGVVENIEDSAVIAGILEVACEEKGVDFVKDVAQDAHFTFSMPPTEDEKYCGATFVITVRLTVTHANGNAV